MENSLIPNDYMIIGKKKKEIHLSSTYIMGNGTRDSLQQKTKQEKGNLERGVHQLNIKREST